MNEDFEYIVAIGERGSISEAARDIHVSQPGLSKRLKRIEAELGVELFDRAHMPLRPTPAGEVYLRYARRALTVERNMRREVSNASRSRKRRLRIGVSMPRANALLPGPVLSFYAAHCGCSVELCEMVSLDQMHRLFLCEEVDFAVLTPIAPDPSAYDLEVLCREQLIVAAADDLRAPQLARAHGGRLDISDLEGLPLVVPACGDYYDPIIGHLVDASRAQLEVVVQGCSADLALRLAREGLGASIVPSTWVAGKAGRGLSTFELDNVSAGQVLRYIRRADSPLPEEEALFMRILRRSLI